MYTILGAGGPTANALTEELLNNHHQVRLVSRTPITTNNKNLSWAKADLLKEDEIFNAAKGSEILYLCAGLVYDSQVWKVQWPILMQNIINVAKKLGARLIFVDNVYMYGLVSGSMKETTPYHPNSVKGEVRAEIANTLMQEAKAGNLNVTIARSADFYGTDSLNSFFDSMVLNKFAKKQKAQWIGKPSKLHSFTYIPDIGKALYLLGQHPETANQIWHLPTAAPITGKEVIDLAAEIYGVAPKFSTVNKLMLQIGGLFSKVVAGTVEMYYQYDHDYHFDSSKFEKHFNFKPTSYIDGIRNVSATLIKKI
ncbi:nucleoside-diphosphate-sugar epimerase [Pedobacter sp. UYP30]|uniref:NAD-dependent epimerase/dehydratase family protein n=1 Tax=Pedobacter sp. UYP30 TaxID=1756400 RepID=UPI003392FF6E